MKNLSLFGLLFLAFFFFFSCTSINRVPYIYTNNINTEFEILGEIFIESNERVGYIELLNAARNLYPECHFVIDIMMDQIITNKVKPFRRTPEITDIIWRMRCTAIKYKEIKPFASLGSTVSDRTSSSTAASTARSTNNFENTLSARENNNNYSVASVTGQVQSQQANTERWIDVKRGDILNRNALIRTSSNSTLVISDGINTITIPGGSQGRIDSLVIINKP